MAYRQNRPESKKLFNDSNTAFFSALQLDQLVSKPSQEPLVLGVSSESDLQVKKIPGWTFFTDITFMIE